MIQSVLHSIISFLDLAALSVLVGVALCLFGTAHSNGGEEGWQPVVPGLRRLLMFCLIALCISSIANLVQRTMEMSGLGIGAILPVLPTVLVKTHYGRIGLVRSAGLAIALIAWFVGRLRLNSRIIAVLMLCASAAVAFSRSATSHAADFGDLSWQELSDWLHLLASSSWAGSLIVLATVFPPSAAAENSLQQRVIAGIADRFYVLFGPALSVLVLTGLYNAWIEVGSFGVLMTTSYGRVLSAKLVLFFLLTFRYIAPPQRGKDTALFVETFLRRTRVDAALAIGVLFCAAVLTHNIPARHSLHLVHDPAAAGHVGHESGQHEHYGTTGPEPVVRLETTPKEIKAGTPVAITIYLEGQNAKPLEGLTVHHERILHAIVTGSDLNVFAHIHPEDVGPVTNEMLRKAMFPLRFTFPKAGEYLVGLDFATADGLYSKTAYIKVFGGPGMEKPGFNSSREKDFGEYHVTFDTSPKNIHAGEETTLRYSVQKNGKPLTDLAPYLGAPMHLAVVSADLKQFIHAHGVVPEEAHTNMDHMDMHSVPEKFGPAIDAVVVFPVKGTYKIFSQVKHRGRVILFNFMVNVE